MRDFAFLFVHAYKSLFYISQHAAPPPLSFHRLGCNGMLPEISIRLSNLLFCSPTRDMLASAATLFSLPKPPAIQKMSSDQSSLSRNIRVNVTLFHHLHSSVETPAIQPRFIELSSPSFTLFSDPLFDLQQSCRPSSSPQLTRFFCRLRSPPPRHLCFLRL